MPDPPTPRKLSGILRSSRAKQAVELALLILAILLCWADVRWALRPGLFPILDELSNPALFLSGSYHQFVHFFPTTLYADRPIGWALMRLLPDLFGFDYTRQVACSIAIHLANCILAFFLFRKVGTSTPVALAGMAFFGSLWTSAWTATYLGATDVSCLFFLLASVLAMLSERRGATILSALLYLAALRTKEFAIVTPVVLTVLLALQLPRLPLRQTLASLARRLWLHYLILLMFGLRYVSLIHGYRTAIAGSNPYVMHLNAATVLDSFAYYTATVFGIEYAHQIPPLSVALPLAAILCWAVLRRRAGIAFGLCGYVLTLLPVAMIANRTVCYVYGPQAFLILALCLLAEEAIALFQKTESRRWIAGVCLALLCFAWCLDFRRSQYFRNRIDWTYGIRAINRRSAHDIDSRLPAMGPGTHVYVSHNPATTPWIFITPCPYLQLINKQRGITCIVDKPTGELRTAYAADTGPKYLLDYHDDGTFAVLDASRPAAAANR